MGLKDIIRYDKEKDRWYVIWRDIEDCLKSRDIPDDLYDKVIYTSFNGCKEFTLIGFDGNEKIFRWHEDKEGYFVSEE